MNPEEEHIAAPDVAIIGYAARFPGAENAAQFWDNLCLGVESIRSFTTKELESVGVSKTLLRDPDYVRAGAPLAHVSSFDAEFFGINPREAAIMDPQQRFFLEGAWEAIEHAGYAPGTFSGSTGVFAGSGPNSYLIQNLLSDSDLLEKEGIFLLRHTGNDKDVLATRLSYQMNLRGPSLAIQTACSTSLVAVHYACQSLLNLDCDMAVAGAVCIEMPHAIGYPYRQNEIQSHDGHCRAFDASASGTVFGSGMGIVILRRLSEAIEAGDTIHAVIKGTAVNNDGNRKVGFLAPSVEGQVEVILEALGVADVPPSSVDYVETHGTATPIGDPIELSALDLAFTERDRKLKIGSVKTNIGHLDTAAGMAGLLKTVLALGHKKIPATLHFKKLNPLVDAARTKLEVVDRLTEWKKVDGPRRAGVTSLGIGGTNAHVILEEAPPVESQKSSRSVRLITLSAKSMAALDDAKVALADHLRAFPEENLDDVAHTLHVGRSEFPFRTAFLARDRHEALQAADAFQSPAVVTGKAGDAIPVAFLFSGQGSQYCNMGVELYRNEPVFREWIDTCAAQAQPHLGFDFREILYPSPENAARAAEQIVPTWNAQPIIFAVEYALAQLWMSWGVKPAKLIGHSLGEYTAACLSGVFTLSDALSLVCARGNLMRKVAEGAMLAVSLSEAAAAPYITDGLSLAAVNGAEQCVISGPTDKILALRDRLKQEGIASHRLETSHAFHSSLIEPVLPAFIELLRSKKLGAPKISIVSNVTGTWLTEKEATDPAYWARHFRETVRFHAGLGELQTGGENFLIEIGPGETLSLLARQQGGKEAQQKIFPSLSRLSDKPGELSTMLFALGNLWVRGGEVDWNEFHAHEKLRRIPLPTYRFQRKKFWMGPKIGTNWLTDSLGKVDDWFYRPTWKKTPLPTAATSTQPWLILGDSSAEGRKLVEQLRKSRTGVISVVPGEKFEALSDDSYALNFAAEGDYAQLFDHLIKRRQTPRHIVHLWGLIPATSAEDRNFHSLVFLLQTLGARLPDQAIGITAFTQRSVSIQREPVLHPYGALVSGPCRVAPLEYPALRCRQVDVDAIDAASLVPIVLAESESDTPGQLAVYREGTRWTQDIERVRLEPATGRLCERGVYLITGGLGGIGMAVADCLVRSCRAQLVLLSRQADAKDAALQSRLEEWRRLGSEVLVLSADVTDRESLRAALKSARDHFGPLNGIIHAAGILRDGIIQLKKRAVSHSVLAPKTAGVEILDELTRGEALDFFALFSSVSALTPPDGQVDYCAANAFLNAYAQSQPAERNFIVIGWGAWSEIGMVAPKPALASQAAPFHHPMLERVELDTVARSIYAGTLSVERHWVLGEHHFHAGDSLLPGTAYIELAVTALWKKLGRQPITLENIVFLAPLRVAPNSPIEVQAELRKTGTGFQFSVTSRDVDYVSGQCRASSGPAPKIKLKEILGRCPGERKEPRNVRQRGHFDFGPRWQSLRQISFGKDECLGLVELPAEYRDETRDYSLHPALMDIATGVAMYLIPGYDKAGDLLLPFAYKRLTVYSSLPARVYSHTRIRHDNGADLIVFDITLANENGDVVAEIEEFTVKRLRSVADLSHLEADALPWSGSANSEAVHPLTGIPTREGIEVFQRILKSRISTEALLVSPAPLVVATPARQVDTTTDSITAGSDDVELVLSQLWQRLLGLDQVDAKTDFFDSGGHSLLAVRLFTEIRKRFNIDFGLSTLFEARTIGALAELIRKAREADPTEKTQVGHSIVSIRSGGTNTPLFLIHDVGGSVLRYEHLARHFPNDQSMFAIESRGLSGLPVDYNVEAMARHYIEQIRERQPHGPYFVVGHSFGGLVTYEIARQLTAQNETMGLVGLLDTYQRNLAEGDAQQQETPKPVGRLSVSQRIMKDVRTLVWGQDRIGYLQERSTFLQAWLMKTVYRAAYKICGRFGWEMPTFLRDVKEANWIAADNYTPGSYEGKVVLFRCENRIPTDPPDSSRIWQRLVKGEVVVVGVPGDHNSMLREPNVPILAEQILSHLKPAATTAQGTV
jgi:acyl transferase domain-containing protein/thioesterase domain-containing protein/acyl carrier protein